MEVAKVPPNFIVKLKQEQGALIELIGVANTPFHREGATPDDVRGSSTGRSVRAAW